MLTVFHHVISTSYLFWLIVGATVSFTSSGSEEHAVNRLAAVQIQIVDAIVDVRGAVVVMVFTDVGKNDEATIHVVVRVFLMAFLVFSRNIAVLLD